MEPLSRMLKLYHPTLEIKPAQKCRIETYGGGILSAYYFDLMFMSETITTTTQLNLSISNPTVKYNI